ncbi:hypothetical protein KQ945_03095 [Bacillus subtilis subsp. subtilis]|nr:hypothetical protein [Bacillus subtilis subsp. subtilis]
MALFEAQCAQCLRLFAHPSLGDAAYAQLLLCSGDGRHHAVLDGFADVPAQVAALLPDDVALWPVLAALAVPPTQSHWTLTLHCPHCGAADPAYQQGRRCGSVEVPMACFAHPADGIAAGVAQIIARQ